VAAYLLLIAVTNVTFLAFLYVTLAARIPRQFWIFLAVIIAWLAINFAFPNSKQVWRLMS
jgi:hypothetical protein